MYRSKPFALTYAIRPATIADLLLRNGSSRTYMEPFSQSPPLFESHIRSLRRLHQGKVRDIYDVDADHLLIVTTDRLSAFDVVLPDPIPHKGEVLTRISAFWFGKTRHLVANHLTDLRVEDIISDPEERAQLTGRAMVVNKLTPLPIEAVVRGYLIGSGYKDYQLHGSVCGVALPAGLQLAQALPEPIFTPASKAPAGQHDENVDFESMVKAVGREHATAIRRIALAVYGYAARHARARNVIIADTKFEFGIDKSGNLLLIDEALTPDSSRFWPVASYKPGVSPPSFDKQFVRDYLESIHWNKKPPAPHLPPEVIARTSDNYRKALELLTA
jgi:phosphoribosylaminoimidazole-succinocarboxamide synthase